MRKKRSIAYVLIVIFIVTTDTTSILAEDLNGLVLEIAKTDKLNSEILNNANNKNKYKNFDKQNVDINKRYADINERFDKLSIDEKLQVLKMARQISYVENGMVTIKENESILLDVVDKAAALAAEDDLFFPDLTDEEMSQYVEKVKNELTDEEMAEYVKEEKSKVINEKMTKYAEDPQE